MYSQTFFVTSVRASVDLPQIAASSVLSFFGAKMPLPAFFWANAIFLDALPARRFSAVIFFNAAFVIVVFFVVVVATVVFVVVVATVVFVVVVIAVGRMRVQTRLEPK